jgi:hypothetical protein
MKITRPLWAKGVFMTPQHFQQQAMWNQFADERIARMISADPWGLSRVVFDAAGAGRQPAAAERNRRTFAGRHVYRFGDG